MYTLFTSILNIEISSLIHLKSLEKEIRRDCSELIVFGKNKKGDYIVIFGILVSDSNKKVKERIKNKFINNLIIRFNNHRPITLKEEVPFDILKNYIRQPHKNTLYGITIYSMGSVCIDFLIDSKITVNDMLKNYIWDNYIQ